MVKKLLSFTLAALTAASVSSSLASFGTANVRSLLKDDSLVVYDEDLGYLKGIFPDTAVKDFKSDFISDIAVKDASGNDASDDAPVGTDFTVTADGTEFKTLVYGDINRDGKVDTKDVIFMIRKSIGWDIDANMTAFDVNRDGVQNSKDIITVIRKLIGWNLELGYTPFRADTSKINAPDEDESLLLTFGGNTEKLNAEADTANGRYSYVMELAGNESEFCQAYLAAKADREGLNISISAFADADGNILESEMLREEYYTVIDYGVVPESLPPVAKNFKISADRQQGFFIRVTSAENQKPGLYRALLSVTDADGKTVKNAYVYAKVWDFSLPVETSCKTAFGMSAYTIYTTHGVTSDENRELYTKYYEYFLKNRINIWCMPFDPLTDEADAYMSDPRVNTFLVAGGYNGHMYGGNRNSSELKELYEKISANEDWAKKAIFYMNDEPMNQDQLASVISNYNMINKFYPNARIVVPQHVNYFFDDADIMSVVTANSTLLCPHETMFIDPASALAKEHLYTQRAVDTYGKLTDRMNNYRAEGKETWWYTSDTPRDTLGNLLAISSGMESRMLFWEQYKYDMDGMLFWATNEWTNLNRRHQINPYIGLLVYPGKEYKIDGPVSCIRTEIARDGIEDFEYLSLIEKYIGKDKADEFTARLVTNVETFVTEPENLCEVRREMAKLLESAMK